jgi:RimJ/RimL family protein N-acetyltransferase/uncharacterized damage-inducible protein DinB
MILRTERLRLVPATPDLVRADLAGPARLAAALGHPVPESWPPPLYDRAAMEQALAQLEAGGTPEPWTLHYVIGPEGAVAGIGGYKGPPDRDGTVEIGYSILPAFQRRGFATEAARALVETAFRSGAVSRVIAETLPGLVPSIRVMERSGLHLAGEGSEPGVVRYQLSRRDWEAGHRSIPDQLSPFFRLLGHLEWADHRAFESLARGGTASPVEALALLAHVLGAEHVWLSRLRGTAPTVAVWPELDLERCRALARANTEAYRDFLFGLEPPDLDRPVEYRNSAGDRFTSSVTDILLQVFLHGAYHRGQIATRLRAAGVAPEPTDYIAFARGAAAATRAPR